LGFNPTEYKIFHYTNIFLFFTLVTKRLDASLTWTTCITISIQNRIKLLSQQLELFKFTHKLIHTNKKTPNRREYFTTNGNGQSV